MRVVLCMVLFIFFQLVLQRLGFGGIPSLWLDLGLVYPFLVAWLVLFSISRLLFLMLTFVAGRVFEVGLCWMSMAPCSSLILLMLEREIRLCFAASWLGVSGMVFFFVKFVVEIVPCQFCGAPDGDGHLFWECTFPPLVEIRENPEFHDLMRMDKGHWPRCLLWHGWLPKLSGVNGASPWADSASYLVESALGGYSSGLLAGWGLPVEFDAVEAASLCSDGSLVLDRVTGVSSSDAGFFAHLPVSCWDHRCWDHVDPVRSVGDFSSCQGFCSVPGPLQSVQRAEMRGIILALQSSGAVHLGVDNLSVVRHVGRLLDAHRDTTPFELVRDGDLLLLI